MDPKDLSTFNQAETLQLMIDKQKQSIGSQGLGIQSRRDTVINSGVSTEQMREIMECVADQLPKYATIAASIVEERLKTFEEKIINRFQNDEKTQSDAFKDPDFQYLLLEAQRAYSRSGNENVAESLSDLIAERSKVTGRSRKTLTLNRAIEVAPLLTENEIAEISLRFALTSVNFQGAKTAELLGNTLNNIVPPFIDHISREQISYNYIESIGCGTVSMGECTLIQALAGTYSEAIAKLSHKDEIVNESNEECFNQLVLAGFLSIDSRGRVVQQIRDQAEFFRSVQKAGITGDHIDDIFNRTVGQFPTTDDTISLLSPYFPNIGKLFELWDETALKNLTLSAVGMAIGYINLRRSTIFDGNIDIWIN